MFAAVGAVAAAGAVAGGAAPEPDAGCRWTKPSSVPTRCDVGCY